MCPECSILIPLVSVIIYYYYIKFFTFYVLPSTFSVMVLATNLESIQQRISAACARAGRDPASVTLLAVTKSQPPEIISEAAKLGDLLYDAWQLDLNAIHRRVAAALTQLEQP